MFGFGLGLFWVWVIVVILLLWVSGLVLGFVCGWVGFLVLGFVVVVILVILTLLVYVWVDVFGFCRLLFVSVWWLVCVSVVVCVGFGCGVGLRCVGFVLCFICWLVVFLLLRLGFC